VLVRERANAAVVAQTASAAMARARWRVIRGVAADLAAGQPKVALPQPEIFLNRPLLIPVK
jgi:hypothetical protein